MLNINDFADIIAPRLHNRIFLNDPKLLDSNVYMNRKYSSTLQQLYILKNWEILNKRITHDKLWAFLKLYEYRSSKLVFDGVTGNLIGDKSSQDLYKQYYYNTLWIDNHNDEINVKSFLNVETIVIITILLCVLYYISNRWEKQNKTALNILNVLQDSTVAQQWTSAQ